MESLSPAEEATQAAGRASQPAHVVVFVSGPRPRVEAALAEARELYPSHHFSLVTEPECRGWLPDDAHNHVFVTPRPFRLFARTAKALRQTLSERPIQACILVVAGTGHESLRFRLFALRLRATEYYLLPRSISTVSRALHRWSFLRFAITAALLRGIRALSWLDAVFLIALAWIIRVLPRRRAGPRVDGKPRIVHLIPTIGTGGAQRQLTLFLKNRTPAYEHRLLALSSTERFSVPAVTEAGIPVTYLESVDNLVRHSLEMVKGRRRWLVWLWPVVLSTRDFFPMCGQVFSLAVYLKCLQPRPEVLHCWLLLANVVGPPAARLAGVRRVITSVRNIQSAVDYNYYNPRWQRVHERVTARLADAVIANAPTVARDYRAFARVPADKIVTVPNGIELEKSAQTSARRAGVRLALGLAPDDLVVGTVARLAKEKDFTTFLRVIAIARERLPELRAMIVGDGPLRSELETFAAGLGLGNGVVQFLGERSDAAAVVTSYDAFLLTSVIEGMPNAVMESQLAGVPVVATRAGGTVDLIRDGETGLLAPIGDAKALAAALVRLLTDKSLHDRISCTARQQIRNDFPAEMLVRRTEGIYHRLLATAELPPGVPCAE